MYNEVNVAQKFNGWRQRHLTCLETTKFIFFWLKLSHLIKEKCITAFIQKFIWLNSKVHLVLFYILKIKIHVHLTQIFSKSDLILKKCCSLTYLYLYHETRTSALLFYQLINYDFLGYIVQLGTPLLLHVYLYPEYIS